MDYAGDLSPQDAYRRLVEDRAAVLVDVRTRAEWTYVGVPDLAGLGREALLIEWIDFPGGQPNSHFLNQLRETTGEGATLLFLCRSGGRSAAAAKAATEAGLGPAYNIATGFEGDLDDSGHRGVGGWKSAGLPWRQS